MLAAVATALNPGDPLAGLHVGDRPAPTRRGRCFQNATTARSAVAWSSCSTLVDV